MASFSWRHPFRGIKEIILGPPEQPRQEEEERYTPPPPPIPPRPPIDYPPFDNYDYDDRRREIWTEISGESATGDNAEKAWEIFEDTGIPTGHGYFETNELFEEFLRAFWLDSDDDGFVRRTRFYEDADITPALIDWPEWREWRDTPK